MAKEISFFENEMCLFSFSKNIFSRFPKVLQLYHPLINNVLPIYHCVLFTTSHNIDIGSIYQEDKTCEINLLEIFDKEIGLPNFAAVLFSQISLIIIYS